MQLELRLVYYDLALFVDNLNASYLAGHASATYQENTMSINRLVSALSYVAFLLDDSVWCPP